MVMHIFYVFSLAPVHCNDNKSDIFSNQSTLTTMIVVMTTFIVVKEAVFFPDPILLQQAGCG